ncbi:DUF6538 domain-containing protein [Roseibium alexandrii]|uniref:DUF6538 domain-containing protein n=1 Tax=Roseibium alexandrii TaxID=388408 RepID=UPI0039EEC3CE
MANQDRYLQMYRGRWRYWRRVPKAVQDLDTRGVVQVSLGTSDKTKARIRRDAQEEADNLYWAALQTGGDPEKAADRYDAAKARAKALGVTFRSLDELIAEAPIDELVKRINMLDGKTGVQKTHEAEAVLGAVPQKRMKISDAYEEFIQKCCTEALAGKSVKQVKSYKKIKLRAVNNFIKLNGDLYLDKITPEHGQVVYDWWAKRVAGDDGPKVSANSANRDLGDLRRIYRDVSKRLGNAQSPNPFADLTFRESKRQKKKRPPFPEIWIREKLLVADGYTKEPGVKRSQGINREALKIFLTVIGTGCRPSEICNIRPGRIHMTDNLPKIVGNSVVGEIPYLEIEFEEDREIKTETSIRNIPLVGIAYEAMKRSPNGFPRYKDKEDNFSQIMRKHLLKRGLFPTEDHKIYSARHSFEDRMKKLGIDSEMRVLLMGHGIDREEYGVGGDMELRYQIMAKVDRPYDPKLLDVLDGRLR